MLNVMLSKLDWIFFPDRSLDLLMRPMFFLHLCPGKWTTTLYVIICRNSIIISSKVCDNVDLKIILEEYSSYHQVKYGKRPDICRRAEKDAGSEGHSLQGNPARRKKAQRALNKMKRWPIWHWQCSTFTFQTFNWNKAILAPFSHNDTILVILRHCGAGWVKIEKAGSGVSRSILVVHPDWFWPGRQVWTTTASRWQKTTEDFRSYY